MRVVPRSVVRGVCGGADQDCRIAKVEEAKASGFVVGRILRPGERAVRQLGPPWGGEGEEYPDHNLRRYEEEMQQQMKKIMEKREELERREAELERRETEMEKRPEPPAPIVVAGEGEKGKLSINSVPWAKVFVDGRPVGNTPLADLELDAGEVTVTLEGPEGKRITRKVVIQPGKSIKMVVRLPDVPAE